MIQHEATRQDDEAPRPAQHTIHPDRVKLTAQQQEIADRGRERDRERERERERDREPPARDSPLRPPPTRIRGAASGFSGTNNVPLGNLNRFASPGVKNLSPETPSQSSPPAVENLSARIGNIAPPSPASNSVSVDEETEIIQEGPRRGRGRKRKSNRT